MASPTTEAPTARAPAVALADRLRSSAVPAAIAVAGFFALGHTLSWPWVVLATVFVFRQLWFDPVVPTPRAVPPLLTNEEAAAYQAKRSVAPTSERVCVVTGASGFTGKVMVAHLLKANLYDKIHAVDIVRPTFESPTVINHQADIAADGDALDAILTSAGAGVVMHIASLVDLRDNVYRRTRLYDINVRGTAMLLNACIRNGVRAFVYLSSGSVVTDLNPRPAQRTEAGYAHVKLEDLPTHYAKSKKMAEDLALSADGIGGMRTVALRPFMIFGAGDRLTYDKLLTDPQMVFLDEGTAQASFVYVKNLAHWIALAARALVSRPDDIAGKAFFVTNSLNEQATAYAQVRQAFIKRRTLPTPVKVTILPPAVVHTLMAIMTFVDWFTAGRLNAEILQLNKHAVMMGTMDGVIDATQAARLLGYSRLYSLEEAFDDTVAELKARRIVAA